MAASTANVTDLVGLETLSTLVSLRGNKSSHCQISWQASCKVLLACCSTTCCHFPVVLTTAERSRALVSRHSVSKKRSSSGILT